MPKLPFTDFDGSSSYYVTKRDKLAIRYRFPWMEKFQSKSSRFYGSRHEKRAFFEWARKFLKSGGQLEDEWQPTAEADARIVQKIDESIALGEAIQLYLEHCESGNRWMKPKSPVTLRGVTRPWLKKFQEAFGANTPLSAIDGDRIAAFIRDRGGKKESKERRLSPISNLFTWARRERYLKGDNPCHGIVFWREPGERPHDGTRKSYTDDEFNLLIEAAQTDPFASDGIYLSRYLALRPADAAELRWEDFKWDQLFVVVRRQKTRESGVEVCHVDMHPVLADRFAVKRGEKGYCLVDPGKKTKIVWPPIGELQAMVDEKGYSAVGRALSVSNNAVKKRLQRDPRTAKLERNAIAESLSSRVGRITRDAGLYEEGVQPTYVLRHTFASDNLRRGVPPAIVAKEMGISIDTLMTYYFHAIPRGELDDRRANRWGLKREDVE